VVMRRSIRCLPAAGFTLAGLALAGCWGKPPATTAANAGNTAGPAANAGAPTRGGTLRVAFQQEPQSLDPAIGYDTYSLGVMRALHAGLLDFNEKGEVVGDIAERWEVAPDGLTYTFHLRPGVRFSNGRDVDAGDFQYTLNRVLQPKTKSPGASYFTGIVGAKAVLEGKAQGASGIQAPDAQTFVVRLERPNATMLKLLASQFLWVVPNEEVAAAGADFGRKPVGAGPFTLQSWISGQSLLLTRNTQYYRDDRPHLESVQVRFIPQESTQLLALQRGDLDLLAQVPVAEFGQLRTDPKWSQQIVQSPFTQTWFLGMNVTKAPFTDARVRQAVNHAIDRETLVKLSGGRGVPAYSLLPPNLPAHSADLKPWSYDPVKAKQLLQEAGYQPAPVDLYIANAESQVRIGNQIVADLKAVGMPVTLRPVPLPTLIQTLNGRKAAFFYNAWFPDYFDAYAFLEPLLHSRHARAGTNRTDYANSEVDRLLDRSVTATREAEHTQLLQQAEAMAMGDAPYAPLTYAVETRLVAPGVGGVTIDPVWPIGRFSEMWKGP
jgi:ABC-type transport system substrate-binding protein